MISIKSTLVVISLCSAVFAAEEKWVELFNGKDLEGWVQRGGTATYKVEDGVIVGTSASKIPNSFLCTKKDYSDFILEYEFKIDPRLNSGVQIRSQSLPSPIEVTWEGKVIKIPAGRVHGYQIEIDPNPYNNRMWSGGIYEESRRGWLYPPPSSEEKKTVFSEQGRRLFKQDDWNKIRLEAIGDSLKVTLNGEARTDLKDSFTSSGFIGLQVHAIPDNLEGTQVRWRNLRIQEVPAPEQNKLTAEETAAGWKLLWDGKPLQVGACQNFHDFPKSDVEYRK
ncbi:MAG: DUF1080 domain-containing protein, partial [Akkermansiaceae bacterium]|nr:DUF1080 domain-containing protein [Akkermansiaceae bacterium]